VIATATCDAWGEGWRLIRRVRAPLAAAVLLIGVSRMAALGLPAASRIVVDDVIGHHRLNLLLPLGLLVSLAMAVEAVTTFAATQAAAASGQKTVAALRRELTSHVVRLPLGALDEQGSAVVAARIMTDPEQVRFLVGTGSVQLAASVLTGAIALGLLLWLEPALTVVVVLLLGGCAAYTAGAFGRLTPELDRVLERHSVLAGSLAQRLAGLGIVKAYAAERLEVQRWSRDSHGLVRQSIVPLGHVSRLSAAAALASELLGILLLLGGAWSVTRGRMTMGGSVMYAWLAAWLVGPVLHLAAGAGELSNAVAALRRIAELKARPTEDGEDRMKHRIRRVVGEVMFDRVSFKYSSGVVVLRDITLHCPAGSTTAVIGPNGSGKTTLCRLLLACGMPSTGRILVDGRDLASLHRRSYRANLGVVHQDDFLFDGSIADNIRYGRSGATLEQIRAAGRLAHCDDFVSRLQEGYFTRVGERGARLSAGQRQLIAIARALLVDPRILVLDEATSSLDADTERLIVDALRVLCRGRTTFIVAHRPATICVADTVIALERGTVVERRDTRGRPGSVSVHDAPVAIPAGGSRGR
jgi:ABC-type multidrug transport system fused ATPase/permease subunit